jgi:hypothetical protein
MSATARRCTSKVLALRSHVATDLTRVCEALQPVRITGSAASAACRLLYLCPSGEIPTDPAIADPGRQPIPVPNCCRKDRASPCLTTRWLALAKYLGTGQFVPSHSSRRPGPVKRRVRETLGASCVSAIMSIPEKMGRRLRPDGRGRRLFHGGLLSRRQAGSTWLLIVLASATAGRPDLLPPAAGAGAVRRLRPAVTLPAWGDLRRSPQRVACTASRPR